MMLFICLTPTVWLTFALKFSNLLCYPTIPSSVVSCSVYMLVPVDVEFAFIPSAISLLKGFLTL